MRCRHCGKRLAILKKFTGGEFCSEAHRKIFQEEQEQLALARLVEERQRYQFATSQAAKPPIATADWPAVNRFFLESPGVQTVPLRLRFQAAPFPQVPGFCFEGTDLFPEVSLMPACPYCQEIAQPYLWEPEKPAYRTAPAIFRFAALAPRFPLPGLPLGARLAASCRLWPDFPVHRGTDVQSVELAAAGQRFAARYAGWLAAPAPPPVLARFRIAPAAGLPECDPVPLGLPGAAAPSAPKFPAVTADPFCMDVLWKQALSGALRPIEVQLPSNAEPTRLSPPVSPPAMPQSKVAAPQSLTVRVRFHMAPVVVTGIDGAVPRFQGPLSVPVETRTALPPLRPQPAIPDAGAVPCAVFPLAHAGLNEPALALAGGAALVLPASAGEIPSGPVSGFLEPALAALLPVSASFGRLQAAPLLAPDLPRSTTVLPTSGSAIRRSIPVPRLDPRQPAVRMPSRAARPLQPSAPAPADRLWQLSATPCGPEIVSRSPVPPAPVPPAVLLPAAPGGEDAAAPAVVCTLSNLPLVAAQGGPARPRGVWMQFSAGAPAIALPAHPARARYAGRPQPVVLPLPAPRPRESRPAPGTFATGPAAPAGPPLLPRARLSVAQNSPRAAAEKTSGFVWNPAWVWDRIPSDLRWLALVLPLAAVLLWQSGARTAAVASSGQKPGFNQVLQASWLGFRQNIASRAAIELQDDFRSGLSAWEGESNWYKQWSFDKAGFVHTGPLALFQPSRTLTDYRLEFLGQIEHRSLGWVFRARDFRNYYAAQISIQKPGPLPTIVLTRYAVMNGKEGPRTTIPLQINVTNDSLYRVQVDVRGSDFVTSIQGRVVDLWTDERLPEGGVGFFSGKGERGVLRWVEVSHQHDMLGRLCAYLAPDSVSILSGSLNR